MSAELRGPWSAALRQAGILVGLSLATAVVLWAVRPDRLPLSADAEVYELDLPAPLIAVAAARQAYEEGDVYFVDTRPGMVAEGTAVPCAFVVREATFDDDLDAVMDFVYPEDPLILYGEGTPLPVGAVAARFIARGYANIQILQGGLRAWQTAGGPVSSKEAAHE